MDIIWDILYSILKFIYTFVKNIFTAQFVASMESPLVSHCDASYTKFEDLKCVFGEGAVALRNGRIVVDIDQHANILEQTHLHVAVESSDVDAVQILIDNNADLDCVDYTLDTPMHLCEDPFILGQLLSAGADKFRRNVYGETALHSACRRGNYVIVNFFVEFEDMKFDCVDDLGQTPLHYVAAGGFYDLTKYLIDSGAKVNVSDDFQLSPLHLACGKGYWEIAKLLHEHGADVNSKDSIGQTAWHKALQNGSLDIAHWLEELGSVRADDESCMIAFHVSCEKGHLESVQYFVLLGIDINYTDANNWNALKISLAKGHTHISDYLIENGARNIEKQIFDIYS